jgi:NADH-quinone oxidoreductase subunit N
MIHQLAQTDLTPAETIDAPSVAWVGLLPLLILAGSGILLLTITSLMQGRTVRWFYAGYTALAGLGTIAACIPLWIRVDDAARGPFSTLDSRFGIDGFSLYATMLIAAVVVLVALVLEDYLRREDLDGPEAYVLVLLSASGGVLMASANDLLVMFLGLEVLSIAVYVLAASHLRRIQSQEAGLKYFVLGAVSAAFFLYGIALTYGATGSTSLVEIKEFLATTVLVEDGLLLAGFALLLVGFGFKVAAVPFHSWTPDVYQGAPTPVTSFMASAVKVAAFAGLLRVFFVTFGDYRTDWQPIVYALAAVTMVVGSLMAITQADVKRMLAYSSVSHAGYLLVGVQAATAEGTAAVLFYLAAYAAMVVGSFTVLTLVAGEGDGATSLDDLAGMARRRPVLAFALAVFLFAQAGVPFTAGFFAKFYVIQAAVDARSFWLAVVAMISAVVAAFLYLRVVVRMYLDDPADGVGPIALPAGAVITIAVALGFTLVFGVWPSPIVDLARDAVPALVFNAG